MEQGHKLLALDLDGTLLDEKNNITEKNLLALKKAQQAGVEVVIATGRMLVSARPFFEKLVLSGPIITYNGALVKDIKLDEIISHQPVNLEITREIIKDTQTKGLHLNLYLDDQLYVAEHNHQSRGYEKSTGVTAKAVGSLLEFVDKPPTKLLVIEENREKFLRLLEEYRSRYKGKLMITESKKHYLEFCDLEATKGKALHQVARKLNIPQQRVIAVGDSNNDLPMIRWAGTGIAVESADPEIKNQADVIAPRPENDGIAYLIDKYVLTEQ
ncbi:MAG: Cof-type HAD-IIB family hydrolase [bacterium]